MEHKLKSWPQYFAPVKSGIKTAELRKDDRNFQVGDVLTLEEWNPDTKEYTGNIERRKVTHITKDFDGMQSGYVMLSMAKYS